MQIDPNQTMPIKIQDLLRFKDFFKNGGRHTEGDTLSELIDARFDAWQASQTPAPNKVEPPEPIPAKKRKAA